MLVVGGGVIGLCCAFVLRRRGFDVTVVDSGQIGGGASSGNGGWICPSLSGPIPGPGVITNSLRWMLRSDSPLLIRPSWDPSYWKWLISFARHCNREDFQAGLAAVSAMASTAARLFRMLEAVGVEFEIHREGVLLLFLSLNAPTRVMAGCRGTEA
ncbi:MAG: FAD-dependent oxidoreductase [Candidatus Dormibacteria bacterium]